MKLLLITIAIPFFVISSFSQPSNELFDKLKKLQKFPATEKQLEKLFNNPLIIQKSGVEETKQNNFWARLTEYDLSEGTLTVFYSGGRCNSENTTGYDLDDGIILSYKFFAKKDIELKSLKLKLKKMEKSNADDTHHLYFTDEKRGLKLITYLGKVQGILFSLPKKYYKTCEQKLMENKKL